MDATFYLKRWPSLKDQTLGIFFNDLCTPMCSTLEDEYRTKKVYGETRIPAGRFRLGLRDEGGKNTRYKTKYHEANNIEHLGMLCIYNEDGWKIKVGQLEFQYCLIHIGNYDTDTEGCVLTGDGYVYDDKDNKVQITSSRQAYLRVYKYVSQKIREVEQQGGECYIEISDSIM